MINRQKMHVSIQQFLSFSFLFIRCCSPVHSHFFVGNDFSISWVIYKDNYSYYSYFTILTIFISVTMENQQFWS